MEKPSRTMENWSKTMGKSSKTMEKSSKTLEQLSKTIEKSSKITEKLNKTMEESGKIMDKSSKTMEKWSDALGKSRKMVCRRRCIWEALDTLESKGVLKQLLSVVGLVLVDLYLLGSNVGPLRSQRSEGTSVSIGCFGRD